MLQPISPQSSFMRAGTAIVLLFAAIWLTATITSVARAAGLPEIKAVTPYDDEDYGFSVAVPEGWKRYIAATPEQSDDVLEPGYAVVFESQRSDVDDKYADYVMVEVLPGAETGAFDSDGSNTSTIMVDGNIAITDKIYLDNFDFQGDRIDLIVFQAEIFALGFTIGIYAIGERSEELILTDAFKLLVRTLTIPEDPFSVS